MSCHKGFLLQVPECCEFCDGRKGVLVHTYSDPPPAAALLQKLSCQMLRAASFVPICSVCASLPKLFLVQVHMVLSSTWPLLCCLFDLGIKKGKLNTHLFDPSLHRKSKKKSALTTQSMVHTGSCKGAGILGQCQAACDCLWER